VAKRGQKIHRVRIVADKPNSFHESSLFCVMGGLCLPLSLDIEFLGRQLLPDGEL